MLCFKKLASGPYAAPRRYQVQQPTKVIPKEPVLLDNNILFLIRKTCVKLMCLDIAEIIQKGSPDHLFN